MLKKSKKIVKKSKKTNTKNDEKHGKNEWKKSREKIDAKKIKKVLAFSKERCYTNGVRKTDAGVVQW